MLILQESQLIPFPSAKLVGVRPRNAGIANYNDQRFLVYRQGPLGGHSSLRICELNEDYSPCNDRSLLDGDDAYEDPRLAVLQDRLWVSYHLAGNGQRSIGVAEVLPGTSALIGQRWTFAKRQPVEKNWIPLAYNPVNDAWVWSYSLHEQHAVWSIPGRGNLPESRLLAAGASPQYGAARGGTNFCEWAASSLLTIAHSSLPCGGGRRRYVAFPVLIDNRMPYAVHRVGSLLMAGDLFHGGYANKMKKAVVFPCGLLQLFDNDYLISGGHNDQEVFLVKISAAVLGWLLERGPQPNPLQDLKQHASSHLSPL